MTESIRSEPSGLQSILGGVGASTPYFPGKGRLWNVILDRLPSLTKGEFIVRRRNLTWKLDIQCVIQRSLFYLGAYEPWDTSFFLSMIKPGQCVVDVGANFGYYTLQAARAVGPQGVVLAFEPSSIPYGRLLKNLELNSLSWVQPYKCALGNASKVVRLAVPNLLNQGEQRIVESEASLQAEEVPISTLDEFLLSHPQKDVHVIKVDIEGYEVEFLRGAKGSIRRYKPAFMVEVNPFALARHGSSASELMDQLKGLGYRCYTARGVNSSYVQLRQIKELTVPPEAPNFFNVFAFAGNPIL